MRKSLFAILLWIIAAPSGFCELSIQDAEEALRNLQFDTVVETLDPTDFSTDEDRAYAVFLRGTAAFNKEDYSQALEFYNQVITDYKESRWFTKAFYRKAECLMFLKRYALAEAIYAKGVEGVLAPARRSEIAGIYIEYADRFFAPEKKGEEPSYDRARSLYTRAVEILPPGSQWERASYQIAMTHFKKDEWEDAQKRFAELIDYYENDERPAAAEVEKSTSTDAPNPYPDGGYLDSALLHRGEALHRLNRKTEARRLWKKLRDTRREETKQLDIIAEAAYRIAKTYDIPSPPDDKALALGVRYLDEYISQFPEHEHVPTAALDRANAYFNRSQFDKALEAFDRAAAQYGRGMTPQQKASCEYQKARCCSR